MSDAAGKTIFITGATDGLGQRVARDLAREGARVILHGRSPTKGRRVKEDLQAAVKTTDVAYYNADFASLQEVRELAESILSEHERIDVLINNAGIGFGAPGTGRQESKDGYELRFQVNYLAGFLLTQRLLPRLKASDAGRIVNVASGAQQAIDFDNVMLQRGYSGNRAYSQSKLAQILYTVELAERLEGVTVNALHPATYMDTNMVREAEISPTNSVQTGADAVEHLAVSAELETVTGEYFNGKRRSRADAQAYDPDARRRLWSLSEELTGLGF